MKKEIEIDVEDLGIDASEIEYLVSIYLRSLFVVDDGKLICINEVKKEFEGFNFTYISTLKIGNSQIDIFKDDENHGLLVEYKPKQMAFDSEKNYIFTVYEIERMEFYYEHSGETETIDLKETLMKNPIINFELVKRGHVNFWKEIKLEDEAKKASESYRI
ncbi:MAG: hypothetical protein QXL86_02305 [Candidatus Aenigmatarchaeota archaeon]